MGNTIGQFKNISQAVKVASIVVHVQEALSAKGHAFDLTAIEGLLGDPEVKAWVATIPEVMLPVKR